MNPLRIVIPFNAFRIQYGLVSRTRHITYNSTWSEAFEDLRNHGTKDTDESSIVHSIMQRKVHRVLPIDSIKHGQPEESDTYPFAFAVANVLPVSSSREVLSIFMEGAGHHSVGRIECFFNAITVMNINIYIQDSLRGDQFNAGSSFCTTTYLVVFQKLQDTQDTVVYIAKS